ncbi:zinc finger, CCHC-type containing protein [Tanacetum coccineum]
MDLQKKTKVARISFIRLLIAFASIHNLIIHQMDVKTTFLNGELDEEVDLIKEFLSSRFSMKDMGKANVILDIRIKHESNRIAISQSYYNEKVMRKFNYFDCTPLSTPMDKSEKLMLDNGQAISQLEYSRVIGFLMYAMTCTKPDIAFAVGKLSRYTSNPGTQNWQAIQRVLKYFKKNMDYSLTYIGYPSILEGCTDASWISNTKDNFSTIGWVFLLGGAASKEAECAATLAKAYSQMYNGNSRHLGVSHSMICELITNGVVSIKFVRSQQNLVNHLMKRLARDLVLKYFEDKLGARRCLRVCEAFLSRGRGLRVEVYRSLKIRAITVCGIAVYRTDFASSQQLIRLYCRGKENGVNILKSIDEGPFHMGTFQETLAEGNEGALHLVPERARVYFNLSPEDKERYNADIRATNILLQGLLKDIYTLINHYTDAQDIWDNVKMLLEVSELTKEDRESQLYDDFEHFRQNKGETIHDYYVRFAKLINDMRNIKMTMSRMQLNSKFVNNIDVSLHGYAVSSLMDTAYWSSEYFQALAKHIQALIKKREARVFTWKAKEEAARQLLKQAPRSPKYVPDPIELEDHVPVYIPELEHHEDLVPAEDEAPTPLLPPSFLSPRIQSPHTRAAIAQMRATAPSTYHLLLPSGTPPLLPIPLPAPSTSHRADIPKADTPPRKRLLLTTPRPGCEVGESSATAAARQPGPTMARRVDGSSKDCAAIRAEIEVLRRERLTYEQESTQTRQDLARSKAYCRALEARVTVLEIEVRRHEWQRQAIDDFAVQHIMRAQALEAGARVDTLEDTGSSS